MKVISKTNSLARLVNLGIAEAIEDAKREGKDIHDMPLPSRLEWLKKDRNDQNAEQKPQ